MLFTSDWGEKIDTVNFLRVRMVLYSWFEKPGGPVCTTRTRYI